jgi:hypothetical protein
LGDLNSKKQKTGVSSRKKKGERGREKEERTKGERERGEGIERGGRKDKIEIEIEIG